MHTYAHLQDTFACPFLSTSFIVLELHFQGQIFESSTLGRSNMIISKAVTYRTNIAIANTDSRMWPLDLHIYVCPWFILKVRVKVIHVSTINISPTVTYRAKITLLLTTHRKSYVEFRLAYLSRNR